MQDWIVVACLSIVVPASIAMVIASVYNSLKARRKRYVPMSRRF